MQPLENFFRWLKIYSQFIKLHATYQMKNKTFQIPEQISTFDTETKTPYNIEHLKIDVLR